MKTKYTLIGIPELNLVVSISKELAKSEGKLAVEHMESPSWGSILETIVCRTRVTTNWDRLGAL